MAAGRCTAVLLALAVATASASAAVTQPPPALVGNATDAIDGHDVMEATHHGSDDADKDDLAASLASVKAMVDIALAFLSAAIQVKGLGLGVVNTVVNVGRFLLELYAARKRPPAHEPPLSYSYSTYF